MIRYESVRSLGLTALIFVTLQDASCVDGAKTQQHATDLHRLQETQTSLWSTPHCR